MIAVAGDDAVVAFLKRRLQPDCDCFLANIKVAEPADEAEPVKLAGLFLEPANQHHLFVKLE